MPKNLLFLAWPQVTEGLLTVVAQVADMFWAGRLGYQAVAGLGVGQIYILMTLTARAGMDAAMRAMIARAIGARQISHANHVLLQALALTALFSLFIAVTGIALSEQMLRVLGLGDEVVRQANAYMQIMFIAIGGFFFQSMSAGALQAAGDSLTPLKAETVARIIHFVLSPLLVLGLFGMPELGLAGISLAMLAGRSVGISMNFFALFRGHTRLRLDIREFRPDVPLMGRMLKIGLPASVTGAQRGISQLVLVAMVAPFGDGAVAAFAVARRVETMANQTSVGIGKAAGALAAQNLGAGNADRAMPTVKCAIAYMAIVGGILCTFFFLFPGKVAAFFHSDAQFIDAATTWILIVALGFLPLSVGYVLDHVFNTVGKPTIPMLVTVATLWGIEIPLSYVLSHHTPLAQYGLPWALVIGSTIRLVILAAYLRNGKWRRVGATV
ncbi:MAG: MATE family efflux transporter [SAR202 cluster bacterium]|nr:MATE family efflux transporter [SAR202 cluster bacterium]